MSSFGTAKVQTDGLNLGFPSPYSTWYANTGRGERFLPDRPLQNPINYIGDDFQAQYHQQKMRDAHYMANAKVRSTHLMNARAFSSPHGYYQMPPPVLGQRKFANPSMGYLDSASARRDQPSYNAPFEVMTDSPYQSKFGMGHGYCPVDAKMEEHRLSGGVLRTTVGQEYGKAKLNDRIRQFNAIDEAKNAFQSEGIPFAGVPTQSGMPFAGAEASLGEQLGVLPQVELAQLLQNVIDALMNPGDGFSAITRFVVGDANKIFALCVRLATNNSAEDIMNALEFIEGGSTQDGITQLLENLLQTMAEDGVDADPNPMASSVYRMVSTLKQLFIRLEQYLKQMLKLADSPARDRQSASKALIKSLGFTKLIKEDAQLFAQVGNANTDFLATPFPQDVNQRAFPGGAFIPSQRSDYDTRSIPYFPSSYRGVAKSNQYIPKRGVSKQEEADAESRSGMSMFSRGGGQDRFTRQAPLREDTQMGYSGDGGYGFSTDYRGAFGEQSGRFVNTVEAPSDEAQQNTGGRPIGYFGAEDLAEEGGEEEGAEGSALAQLSADTSSAVPRMRSVRDPTTGAWDVGVAPPRGASSSAVEEDYVDDSGVVRMGARPGQPLPPSPASSVAPPRSAKPYKSADVPRDRAGLIKFITALEKAHPGYSQGVYKSSSDKSVRINTLRKMAEAGLI